MVTQPVIVELPSKILVQFWIFLKPWCLGPVIFGPNCNSFPYEEGVEGEIRGQFCMGSSVYLSKKKKRKKKANEKKSQCLRPFYLVGRWWGGIHVFLACLIIIQMFLKDFH